MAVVALYVLTSCLLTPAPAPPPAPPPSESITAPSAPDPQPIAPAPAPPATWEPAAETPSPVVAEPGPGAQPPPPDASAPATLPPITFDRVELRNGGVVEGELVEFVPKSHMTIKVRGTEESRTFNWAEVEYVQRAGQPREPVSAGKPTIAELAAESERIERKKKLGLGLAYGGYSTVPLSLIAWAGYGFTQEDEWLVASVVMTSITAGLLTSGAVIFFRAHAERKELRKVILSATPTRYGGVVGVSGRF